MRTDDTDGPGRPNSVFSPRRLRSHVWTDRSGTDVCLLSPSAANSAGARRWLYAEGDAFVDAAAHH